jgi:hypothetical protein
MNYKYGTGLYPATRMNRDPYLSGSLFSTQYGSVAGNSGRHENCFFPVLLIQNVYPESELFPFRIPDLNFFSTGSASTNVSILNQKIVPKLSEI